MEEMFEEKKCCKECRHVKFKGTMTKLTVQKQTLKQHGTRRTTRRSRHLE